LILEHKDVARMRLPIALLFFAASSAATPALAGPILDRIRADGVVRCGGVERPGLIAVEDDGKASGLELDLCRALASVVLGPNGRLEFRRYDSEKAFADVRAGKDDVSFLTGREMIDNGLTGKVIAGPTVFVETMSVMVPSDSPAQRLDQLANRPICFALLQRAQEHLSSWFAARHLDFIRMGFQEDVEMNDAYSVSYCNGVAGEATTLADTRSTGKLAQSEHRFLPETLAAYPVVAASGAQDGEWAAIVAWTIDTLVQAETKETDWTLGGVNSLRVNAPELGLAAGWQKRLVDLVGTYGDLYERNLGAKSELKLPRGANYPVALGGALAAPYTE
jgi:general L-amino acid transport system substrate-binding protein